MPRLAYKKEAFAGEPAKLALDDYLGEMYRRARAKERLTEFARFVEIPGTPATNDDEYLAETVFYPVNGKLVAHHIAMLDAAQRTIETPNGRLMIIAPPGSAKSTYMSVVTPAWVMGRTPGTRIILTTYATRLARKQSRKCLQVVRQFDYTTLWDERPEVRQDIGAAEEWAMTNGSELMAAGILAGITGNRANGIICDDLIAGREEADSPVVREKVMDAFRDDLESRLLPGGWLILINTRWHEDDPSGSILPDGYDGRSGYMQCKDGRTWFVLNLPARAENADDPAGRKVGDYLWPEWFPTTHWQAIENNPLGRRTWIALYQGRPTGESSEDFNRDDFLWYGHGELPAQLRLYGASDLAVTENDPERARLGRVDFSEHGVVGMDQRGDLWFLDWWSGQLDTEGSIEALLDMVDRWKPVRWWDEGGVIDRAIRPAIRKRMRERGASGGRYVKLESLPRIADKRAKCQSFAARVGARSVHFPKHYEWAKKVVEQLIGFPGHRYDDKYDVCGLIGRGIDQMRDADGPPPLPKPTIKPFTGEWLEWQDPDDKPEIRYR
jgi:predicted phage terminase large subunit-like protein